MHLAIQIGSLLLFAILRSYSADPVRAKIDSKRRRALNELPEGQYIDVTVSPFGATYAQAAHLLHQCGALKSQQHSSAMRSTYDPVGLA